MNQHGSRSNSRRLGNTWTLHKKRVALLSPRNAEGTLARQSGPQMVRMVHMNQLRKRLVAPCWLRTESRYGQYTEEKEDKDKVHTQYVGAIWVWSERHLGGALVVRPLHDLSFIGAGVELIDIERLNRLSEE